VSVHLVHRIGISLLGLFLHLRTPAERATDNVIDRELADAERAVVLHYATPEQIEGVRRAAAHRTPDERRRAFRSA
jgi:hypothetical protein